MEKSTFLVHNKRSITTIIKMTTIIIIIITITTIIIMSLYIVGRYKLAREDAVLRGARAKRDPTSKCSQSRAEQRRRV